MPKPYILVIPYAQLQANAASASYWDELYEVAPAFDFYVAGIDPVEPYAVYNARETLREPSPTPEAYAVLMNHLIWPWRPVEAYLGAGQEVQYA